MSIYQYIEEKKNMMSVVRLLAIKKGIGYRYVGDSNDFLARYEAGLLDDKNSFIGTFEQALDFVKDNDFWAGFDKHNDKCEVIGEILVIQHVEETGPFYFQDCGAFVSLNLIGYELPHSKHYNSMRICQCGGIPSLVKDESGKFSVVCSKCNVATGPYTDSFEAESVWNGGVI